MRRSVCSRTVLSTNVNAPKPGTILLAEIHSEHYPANVPQNTTTVCSHFLVTKGFQDSFNRVQNR
jgi:hypothetical protein